MGPIVKSVSEMTIPSVLRKPLYKLYGKVYGVNFQEIKNPVESHASFIDFFTREVKERRINPDGNIIVSPADSKILNYGEVTEGYNQVVKGYKYSIGKFLTGEEVEYNSDDLNKLKTNP